MTKTKQIFITTLSLMFCVMLAFMFSACKISLGGGGNGNSNGGGVVTPTIEKRILYLGADSINSKLSEGQTSLSDQISNLENRIENESNENTIAQLQNQKDELDAGYSVITGIINNHLFAATKTTDENNNFVYDAKTSEILSPFLNDVIPYSSTSPIYFQYGNDNLNDIAKWQISNENNYACIRCYKKYASSPAILYEFWVIKFYYSEATQKITNFEYNYINSTNSNNIYVDQVNYNGSNWSASSTTNDNKIEDLYNQAQSFTSSPNPNSLDPAKVTHTRIYDGTDYTYTKIEPGSSD